MDKEFIKKLREHLRIFDRELYLQNNASCCNGISLAQCHTPSWLVTLPLIKVL